MLPATTRRACDSWIYPLEVAGGTPRRYARGAATSLLPNRTHIYLLVLTDQGARQRSLRSEFPRQP